MRKHHPKRATSTRSCPTGPATTTQPPLATRDQEHNAQIAPFQGTSEIPPKMLEPEYHEALQGCLEGRFTEELRVLYQMPSRQRVPWVLFPNSARPNDPVEGGHEGGSI